jgi:hypothetical protein
MENINLIKSNQRCKWEGNNKSWKFILLEELLSMVFYATETAIYTVVTV